jgi:hypothetical protein
MPKLVRVRLIATTPSQIDKDLEDTHFHDLLDYAPEFKLSKEILDRLTAIEDTKVRIWHLDPTVPALPNSVGSPRVQ